MFGVHSTEVHVMGNFLIGRIKKEKLTPECEEAYIRGVKELGALIYVRNKEKIDYHIRWEKEDE